MPFISSQAADSFGKPRMRIEDLAEEDPSGHEAQRAPTHAAASAKGMGRQVRVVVEWWFSRGFHGRN